MPRPHAAAVLEDAYNGRKGRVLRSRGWTTRVVPLTGYGSVSQLRVFARIDHAVAAGLGVAEIAEAVAVSVDRVDRVVAVVVDPVVGPLVGAGVDVDLHDVLDRLSETVERIVDLLTGWPELNEFKHTSIPR